DFHVTGVQTCALPIYVVGDRHVRVQGVVLEHHGDVPVLGRQVRDVAVADADGAAVHVLQAREHAEGGGLAATGGTDEDEELPVRDLDVERVDGGLGGTRVDPGRLVERDWGHGDGPPSTGRNVPDDPSRQVVARRVFGSGV